jgi:hypothetical protein
MSDSTRPIRWRSGPDDVEHCELKIGASGIAAEGVLIGGSGEALFGLRYRILLDAEWAGVRSLHVTRLGGATVALRHDGYGEWTDGEGKKRPDLSKCLDFSLGQSQFAFTATLKRLAWKAGKTVELPIIHIATPSLDIKRLVVKVTAIEPGKLYRVQPEGGEPQEIAVDADGFVRAIGEFEGA